MHRVLYFFIFVNIFIYFFFVTLYISMFRQDPKNFSSTKPMVEKDLYYYAAMNHSNTGCADIMPSSRFSKNTTSVHVMITVFLNILIFYYFNK
jgi:hypothetical protein